MQANLSWRQNTFHRLSARTMVTVILSRFVAKRRHHILSMIRIQADIKSKEKKVRGKEKKEEENPVHNAAYSIFLSDTEQMLINSYAPKCREKERERGKTDGIINNKCNKKFNNTNFRWIYCINFIFA